MPGSRSTFPARAGSTSIRRAAAVGNQESRPRRGRARAARGDSPARHVDRAASDHLAMKVAVKVIAEAEADTGMGR